MAAESPQATATGRRRAQREFPTTHWSLVLNAGAVTEPAARTALESLCRQYWFPIYAFIRRQGRTHHEAEDLTQGFFHQLLAAGNIARARPERGRFRTFLLAAVRNFLTNEWDRIRAAKRGGGVPAASLDLDLKTADARFINEPADPGLTPEQAFDRTWALGVVEHALAELRVEYTASGRGPLFAALGPIIWGGGAPEPAARAAGQLGLNESALNVALHRLRRRLRDRVEAQIAATVADAGDVADELRYLIATLREKVPAV
jgi:DNA-directed RNA polymerase specialized sigma24 family protein